MLEIERLGMLKPSYAVRDDRGHSGTWARRRFAETLTGELDGRAYEVRGEGRKRFVLSASGRELAAADAGRRGRWTLTADGAVYELRRRSPLRSEMELRSGEATVGTVRRGRAPLGKVVCDLPPELSPPVATFVGLLVVTLWARAAASAGAATSG